MFKRTVILVGLLFALSAPAAFADSGRQDRLHDRIQKVTAAFVHRCADGKADADKCKAAAQKLLDRLETVDGRIDDRIATIQQRCGGGTTAQPAEKGCARADDVILRLRTVQLDARKLADKLRDYLGHASTPAPAPAVGNGSSTDVSGLESLDQLAADLAAAQAAAGS